MQDIIKIYNELTKENWLITKLAIMQEIESFDENYFEFLKDNDISLDNFLNFIIHEYCDYDSSDLANFVWELMVAIKDEAFGDKQKHVFILKAMASHHASFDWETNEIYLKA